MECTRVHGEALKLGISSLLFVRTPIEEAISKSAELGAECFELIYDLPHFKPDYDHRGLITIKELLDSHGLEVSVHASFWDLNPASHYRELWELSLKRVKRSIEACEELGGKVVSLHPGRCPIPEIGWLMRDAKNRYLKFLGECLELAGELGVKLAPENTDMPYCPYSTLDELEKLVGDLENAGVTLDVGHAYRGGKKAGIKNPEQKIVDAIKRLKKKVVHVHLHDNHGEQDEHLPPGEGNIDFRPILHALRVKNYRGLLIAELWDPENSIQTGRKGLKGFEALLGR